MNNYKLYVPNEKQWDQICGKDYYNPHKPGYRIVKNAIIEPPKREASSGANILFRGGICDENGKFVAGHKRHTIADKTSLDIYDAYEVPGEIEYLSGNYIYGGVLIGIFGHVITDCLVNLWWVVKNEDNDDKIIFFKEHMGILPFFWEIAEILGIKERIMVVEKACQVESIIVPDSSFKMFAEYTDEMLTVYKAIGSSVLEKPSEDRLYKKIYLTRTQFSKGNCYGENYFDEFYRKRGYEIIAPETLPFETQIRILNHAEEIVCSIGSMSHMLLFANNRKAKVTFLLRTNEASACRCQIMMNQAIGFDYDIVDVSMNLLPTSQAGGLFIVGPTKYFIQYLDDNKIAYNEDEVQMDWSCLYDYLVAYANKYKKIGYPFRRIKNLDMFDVIDQMHFVFNGTHLDRNEMQTKSKLQLEKEINDLKNNQNGTAVIKFSYYFASTGWIDNIENLQPVVKSSPMEAIQIYNPYPDCKIECQIKQLQIGWQSGKVEANNSLLCGQIEKSLPMTAIRLKVAAGCDNYELLYRAYMKTTGWTRLCSNGEICGSISDECEDSIMGMQIILINHSMDRKKIDKI